MCRDRVLAFSGSPYRFLLCPHTASLSYIVYNDEPLSNWRLCLIYIEALLKNTMVNVLFNPTFSSATSPFLPQSKKEERKKNNEMKNKTKKRNQCFQNKSVITMSMYCYIGNSKLMHALRVYPLVQFKMIFLGYLALPTLLLDALGGDESK